MKTNHFSFLIPAHNEEAVIKNLIDSIKQQNYPKSKIDIFVAADNCTDKTAAIAKKAGATVFERKNKEKIGKGFVLDFLVKKIKDEKTDAYVILDADNLIEKDYLKHINQKLESGEKALTTYRNTKNFDESFVATECSIYNFYLNDEFEHYEKHGRSSISIGPGIVMRKEVIDQAGGWAFQTQSEDAEFSMYCKANGIRIAYEKDAIFYDEQPLNVSGFIKQRIRWINGHTEAFRASHGIVHNVDFLSIIAILLYLSAFSLIFNQTICLAIFITLHLIIIYKSYKAVIQNRHRIKSKRLNKYLYPLFFPVLFYLFFIMFIMAPFCRKQKWVRTEHKSSLKIEDMQ